MSEPLRRLADDLWVAERPFSPLPFFDIGTRMTVIRLPRGGLLLHSPVEADAATRLAVEALGPVCWIACPNRVHHLFAGGWKQAYPAARLVGAPRLAEKRRDLRFDGVLGDMPEPGWEGVLDTVWVQGLPLLEEVVFLHRPSRTLLLTDLAFHPTEASRPGLRLWCRINRVRDGFGPTLMLRLFVRDRGAVRAALDRVLAWDFDRVTVTHGEVLESGGREALRRAWEWLDAR
jgi:hypothetical protein